MDGIKERYKAKCLEKNDGKYWLIQATDEYNNLPANVKAIYSEPQWISKQIDDAKKNPFANGNFLKAEFITACKNIGAI